MPYVSIFAIECDETPDGMPEIVMNEWFRNKLSVRAMSASRELLLIQTADGRIICPPSSFFVLMCLRSAGCVEINSRFECEVSNHE